MLTIILLLIAIAMIWVSVYRLSKSENEEKKKLAIIKEQYGHYIGKKIIYHTPTRTFFDTDNNILFELNGFRCSHPSLACEYIPCVITNINLSANERLTGVFTVEVEKFVDKFKIIGVDRSDNSYLFDSLVLRSEKFGWLEIPYDTHKDLFEAIRYSPNQKNVKLCCQNTPKTTKNIFGKSSKPVLNWSVVN